MICMPTWIFPKDVLQELIKNTVKAMLEQCNGHFSLGSYFQQQ